MREKLKNYKHEIKLSDGTVVVHTVDNPYPPFEDENVMVDK
jgi:hypothetical protein